MNDMEQVKNTPFESPGRKVLPGSLNTLTILTFIGSGIGLLSSIYGFVSAKKSYETMEEVQGSDAFEKMPNFMKNMMGPDALEAARRAYENRFPILILSLVGLALCVYGAMQMRHLKKQGYYLWLIGEILPLITIVVFMGIGALTGIGGIIGLVIVLLFIVLYSTQLKYLK